MRVVVTGASGNIGSATVREISAGGRHQVVGLARRRPQLPTQPEHASVTWRAADVGTDDLDRSLARADALVHLAWKFQPTHEPLETWQTNAVGTRRVLAAARRAGIRTIVCASSVAAYSPADHDDPVDEGWETDGASEATYCREKAYTERVLDAFAAANPEIRLVRIRPAFVFQRSAASEQRRIFGGPLVRPVMFDRRLIPMLPVPAGLRFQAIHAADVASAILAAVEAPVSGAFNLAGPGVLARAELGELLGARTVEVPPRLVRRGVDAAWHARVAQVPGSLLAALMSLPVMSTTRAETELGWRPQHTGAEALEALLVGARQRAGSTLAPLHR